MLPLQIRGLADQHLISPDFLERFGSTLALRALSHLGCWNMARGLSSSSPGRDRQGCPRALESSAREKFQAGLQQRRGNFASGTDCGPDVAAAKLNHQESFHNC